MTDGKKMLHWRTLTIGEVVASLVKFIGVVKQEIE